MWDYNIQINDTINTLDQATQVNANSATVISELANEVTKLSENLLEIANKAKFKEVAIAQRVENKSVPNLKSTPKVLEVNKHQIGNSSAVNQQKTTVITSSTKDDDEWESF